MGERQITTASSKCPHPEAVGKRWGDDISDDRKIELGALADQQKEWAEQPEATRGKSLFNGVELTGAEVFWLAERSGRELLRDVPNLHLEGANLNLAHLEGADLQGAHLEGANLNLAHLEGAHLNDAHLEGTHLNDAYLEGADLHDAHLESTYAFKAHLKRANLNLAHLEGADFTWAHLEDAQLIDAHLEGADLFEAHLERAILRRASLNKTTRLTGASLNGVLLDQVIFDNTNLTVVEWREVEQLGEEVEAQGALSLTGGKAKLYHAAARAYRALATALRAQGLSAEASRFHYRAELMARYENLFDFLERLFSRRFFTAPAAFGRWLISWMLGALAGYGDRLDRLFLTYAIVVSAFAGLMFVFAGRPPSFDSIRDVFVLSITSFHGRGVQPPGLPLTDALATLSAIEAFFGLTIEGIFIAAFTRRVTGG